MKKSLLKLILFSILSVFLLSTSVYADVGTEATDKFIKTLSEDTCIKPVKGQDEGYIVTFVEEPLNNEKKGEVPNDNFVQRPCYRQTFQYTLDGKRQTLSEITRSTCYTSLQELADANKGAPTKAAYSCKSVQAILSRGGTSMLYGYIGMIYTWGASIVGIIAVLIIVISGIQISAGGGDPEAINSAKKRIIQSLSGIAVLFLSGLILYTINPDFFVR